MATYVVKEEALWLSENIEGNHPYSDRTPGNREDMNGNNILIHYKCDEDDGSATAIVR